MAGGLEPDDLQGPFQPKPFYDSIKVLHMHLVAISDPCRQGRSKQAIAVGLPALLSDGSGSG